MNDLCKNKEREESDQLLQKQRDDNPKQKAKHNQHNVIRHELEKEHELAITTVTEYHKTQAMVESLNTVQDFGNEQTSTTSWSKNDLIQIERRMENPYQQLPAVNNIMSNEMELQHGIHDIEKELALATYHEPLQIDRSQEIITTGEMVGSYPQVANKNMLLLDTDAEYNKGTQELAENQPPTTLFIS